MQLIALELEGRRHELVAGLVWHPLQGTGAQRTREIRAFAREAGADLKVLRGDESPHVGLARRADGARPGQVSAAAVIAEALAEEGARSVLAALRLPALPGQLLYVALRDGVILADGDCVAGESELRRRFDEDRAYGGWDRVLCPPEWGCAGAAGPGFESFFPPELWKRSRPWQLRPLRINLLRLVVAPAVLVLAAAAAFHGWRSHRQDLALVAARAQVERQQQEEQALVRRRAEASAPLPPWPGLPGPVAFARACVQAFAQVGRVAGNWKLDGAVCEAGQLTVRWVKASDAAWVSHLRAVRADAVIAGDGLSALVTAPAPAPLREVDAEAEPLQDLQLLRLRYLDLASRYGLAVRIERPPASAAASSLPGQPPAPAAPALPWAVATVQVSAGFDPVEAAALLAAPGLRFSRLVFAFSQDGIPQYQFTGVHYVRP